MNIKLEKWYLDFTAETALGFYYIMCISYGPFHWGFSGINHFQNGEIIRSFRFSRLLKRSFHGLHLGKADFSTSLSRASLRLDHGKSQLSGSWRFLAPPQKRIAKPFFISSAGWSDWKVWTPKAAVDISIKGTRAAQSLKGTGYIDYVRFDLPAWNNPFRRLYWGRMHSENSWAVFMKLHSKDKNLSIYMDPAGIKDNISARLQYDSEQKPAGFLWELDSQPGPDLLFAKIGKELEDEEILSKGRLLKLIPPRLRNKINSYGCDQKYEVFATFKGEKYHGIMEEVNWHE